MFPLVENIDPSPNPKNALGGMKWKPASDSNGTISGEKPDSIQIPPLPLTTCFA